MELIYLLYLIIGIALGALAVFFAMRSQVQAARERSTSTEQQMRATGANPFSNSCVRSKSRNNSRWRSRWHSCASR